MGITLRVKTHWNDPSERIRQALNERYKKNAAEATEAFTHNDLDTLYSLTEAGMQALKGRGRHGH